MKDTIKIVTLNIGNPSIERAKKQVEWIKSRDEDIYFLTETKNSDGCRYIEDSFSDPQINMLSNQYDMNVSFPKSITGDYGVMCLSKGQIISSSSPFELDDQYFCRFLENDIKIKGQTLHTICLYVPSRDQSYEKIIRKKVFLEKSLERIKKLNNSCNIICGDLNILDRAHVPHYSVFKEWEYKFYDELINLGYIDVYKYSNPYKTDYSWVGRTGDGYRYDYCFVNESLSNRIKECSFVHETRNDKLTDHSGLRVEFLV